MRRGVNPGRSVVVVVAWLFHVGVEFLPCTECEIRVKGWELLSSENRVLDYILVSNLYVDVASLV